MIAASAARSTWVTKSFWPLARISSALRSSAARLMMLPARRAALTAVLSRGCMGRVFYYGDFPASPDRSLPPDAPGQHRRRRARDEDHGPDRLAAGRAGEISCTRGAMDGDARAGRAAERQGAR